MSLKAFSGCSGNKRPQIREHALIGIDFRRRPVEGGGLMRLNRYLAAAGEGSRRSCEARIVAGEVSINGVVCTNLATQVEEGDVVKIGNRVLQKAASATLLLHKPPGFLCTASDTHGRRTLYDLVPPQFNRLFHIGRLDKESEGLILLTNNGELSLKLTHPRYKVDKEYEVVLDQSFDFTLSAKLLHGVNTPEGFAYAEEVHRLARNKLKVVLRQGLKRQIRHMFYEIGYEVIKLKRVRIGPISLGQTPPGEWRILTQREIDALLAAGKPLAPRRPSPAATDGEAKGSPKADAARRPARPAGASGAGGTARPTRPSRPTGTSGPGGTAQRSRPAARGPRPTSGSRPGARKPQGAPPARRPRP